MQINERLRELRQSGGYTMKQISKELGITISAYSNYENGIRQPSLEIVKRICIFYEISADYLLGLNEM